MPFVLIVNILTLKDLWDFKPYLHVDLSDEENKAQKKYIIYSSYLNSDILS